MTVGYFGASLADLGLISEIAKSHTLKKLIVQISPTSTNITEAICQRLCQLYGIVSQLQPNLDVRINVEHLKNSKSARRTFTSDVIFIREDHEATNGLNGKIFKLPAPLSPEIFEDSSSPVKSFPNVVLGGTFDRLHVGHKILLTEAVMRCTNKLTVGVTDESMIKGKKLWELIEPVETRITNLSDFLSDVDSSLTYEIVPISDMYGPTRTDPNLNLLVVSEETRGGGRKVNEEREVRGLEPLALHVVDLVEVGEASEGDETKVSSSNGRLRILGTRLRPPTAKNIPDVPYLIGLTGGIASGKSNVARMLGKRGAGVVDCDKIAHSLYRRGTSIYHSVVETFGREVVAEDGEINRKALGAIVFSNKDALTKLNSLLWPEILRASLDEARRLCTEEGKTVVVLEAAVLLQAGWFHDVHEVWSCIVPPAEAVKRIVERNKISEADATVRINSQPSNSAQVEKANVVFSTLLSYEFTESQVAKAWDGLQDYLKQKAHVKVKL